MPDQFDPYLCWLGIRDPKRPPNHYRLLGVSLFESDPQVLSNAAGRQMGHVRTFQTGPHAAASQQLLNELATAKVCLLSPEKKAAYDAALRVEEAAISSQPASDEISDVAAKEASLGVVLRTPVAAARPSDPARAVRSEASSMTWLSLLLAMLVLLALGLLLVLHNVTRLRHKLNETLGAPSVSVTAPLNSSPVTQGLPVQPLPEACHRST